MGYTHYFTISGWNDPHWQPIWAQIIRDTQLIISTSEVHLCGNYPGENYDHEEEGQSDDSENDDDIEYGFDPPLVSEEEGIAINGVNDDGHELFQINVGQTGMSFCKTAGKPYDEVVCCVLLRAYMLASECIEISSDGDWDWEDEWDLARELYEKIWPGEEPECPWNDDIDDDEEQEGQRSNWRETARRHSGRC